MASWRILFSPFIDDAGDFGRGLYGFSVFSLKSIEFSSNVFWVRVSPADSVSVVAYSVDRLKIIHLRSCKACRGTNAIAVRDLQPKISVWNHGGEQGIGGGATKDVAGLYKMLPPVLDKVYEQTGMQPPAWIGTLRGAEPKQVNPPQQLRG